MSGIERFTKTDSTYYEKAIKRLQELEDKIESGELSETAKTQKSTANLIVNYLLTANYQDFSNTDVLEVVKEVATAYGNRA